MKKIVFLCVLSVVLFVVFYLYLTSGHSLGGWQFLLLAALGTGGAWALFEALYAVMRMRKRF